MQIIKIHTGVWQEAIEIVLRYKTEDDGRQLVMFAD